MSDREDEIKQWQTKLSEVFRGPSGIIGERVRAISRAEELHRRGSITRFNGFMTLLDAFQDFGLHTVEEAKQHGHVLHVFSFAIVAATLRRLRSALNEFYNGYYYDAASSLRTVFESVLYLGAVGNGYIRLDAMFDAANRIGATEVSVDQRFKIERKVQVKIDRTIALRMRGKESGLSIDEQQILERMFTLLHAHVHKASSTVTDHICEMMVDRRIPSIAPILDDHKASIFANNAVCAAWAFTRVLPCLSLLSRFSQDWQKRQGVLEESFHFYLENWEKPLGLAFMRFMEMKMTFTDESFKRFEADRETTMVVSAEIP